MLTPIAMTIAESADEYSQAGELIEVACREYVSNLKKYGKLELGNFSEDGDTFSKKQFDDYYKDVVAVAKTYPAYFVHSPAVFVAKKGEEVVCALLVITAPEYPRAVHFSYISTKDGFRRKGIAANLHAFAEEMFANKNVSICIGPQPDNHAAIRCAHRGHEIAMKNGATFAGERINGKLKMFNNH